MYQLKAILCGCPEEHLPQLRRELFRNDVQVEAEFGQAKDAVIALRSTADAKRLAVIHLDDPGDFEQLRQLQAAFSRWPLLAILEPRAMAEELHGLILRATRCGATQVVHLPLEPSDFSEVLEQIAIRFVYSAGTARVIAVAGSTGGCGSTTLAVNLAFELANVWGMRCVLVDLSLKMGTVASHLNIEPRYTMLDLLKDPSRVDTILLRATLERVGENLYVLAGPHGVIAPSATQFSDVRPVLDSARQMSDVVVLDVSPTFDDLYFETLGYAEQVVLVGQQKLPSIRSMVLVREAMALTDSRKEATLVINRFDPKCTGFTVDRLLKPLGVSRLHTIASDWPTLSAAANEGSPLRLHKSDSAVLSDIDALAESLVGPPPDHRRNDGRSMGLWNRLSRALIG